MKADMAPHGSILRPAHDVGLERELVVRASRGEPHACRDLILRHQRAVGGLLQRMLRGSGLSSHVEDLAQETFLRVFKALSRFDPDGPAKLSTWILTIATRLALQAIERRRLPTDPLDEGSIPSPWRDPNDAADRVELGRRIERAVGALAPCQRAAFVLREYHGLDYAEIAEALEIDLGTVKSRLSRARRSLRAALEEVRHG